MLNEFFLLKILASSPLHFLIGSILVFIVCTYTHTPIKRFLALDSVVHKVTSK